MHRLPLACAVGVVVCTAARVFAQRPLCRLMPRKGGKAQNPLSRFLSHHGGKIQPDFSPAELAIVAETEKYVKEEMKSQDGSHDWFHVDRVRNLARKICTMEGHSDHLAVTLAALLHDIKDWKYCKEGEEEDGIEAVKKFLTAQRCPAPAIEKVLYVMKHIGFKSELGYGTSLEVTPELAIVQDADRLDAIGAIGIARTFTYGGARNRALYDPAIKPITDITQAEYAKKDRAEPTINHFYEKLFLLKDRMKTKSGKRMAEARHKYMEEYVSRFYSEWEGKV